jgi:hypothetical protein
MRVLDKIGERVYPTTRDPLLAMGGAVYEKGQQSAPLTQNEGDVAALRRRAGHDLTRSARIGSYYGELGYGQWSDLPGSLKEATEIKALMRGGRAITGSDLRESVVKRLSASGELARYRVIHIGARPVARSRY